MNFQCSRFCRGRREEGTRGSKRKQHSTQKTPQKHRKTSFLEAPGQASKKANQKPRKSHPREAKMTPRSGPGGAGSDPRAPKTTPRRPQERPKSRPKAVSEQPWRPSGADLAPKRLPEPSGEAFGPLGVGFWRLRGSLFEASSASCGALLAEPSGEQAQAQDGSAGHAKRLQFPPKFI